MHWPSSEEGGIQTGDDPAQLVEDAMRCGDGLPRRAALVALADAAPAIVDRLLSLGVMLECDAPSRLPGASTEHAVHVASGTRRAVVHALERELRRAEASSSAQLTRREHHDVVSLAVEDERLHGCVVRSRITGELFALPASTLILCGAGLGSLWGGAGELLVERSLAVSMHAGAVLAHADLVQLTPCALWCAGPRLRVLSDRWRAESGRFWVPNKHREARESRDVPKRDRDWFIDDDHPGWGALVPDDIAARAIHRACVVQERGVYDADAREPLPAAYLDLTHLPEAHLRARLGSELDACTLLTGRPPHRLAPLVHARVARTLGGLWVDLDVDDGALKLDSVRNHSTSVDGLYAVDEAAHVYHGRCAMGGNSLLAEIFAAQRAASAAALHADACRAPSETVLSAQLTQDQRDQAAVEGGDRRGDRPLRALQSDLAAALDAVLGPGDGAPDDALARVESLSSELEDAAPAGTDPVSTGWHHELRLSLGYARAMLQSRAIRREVGRATTPLLRLRREAIEAIESVDGCVLGTRRVHEPPPVESTDRSYALDDEGDDHHDDSGVEVSA
jgi:succinate dehydrogenase / fumarate reductase flavoprotein subunit